MCSDRSVPFAFLIESRPDGHPVCRLERFGPFGGEIGEFEPGNLVLTGPNLPHNWVSDVPLGCSIPLRGRIIQFGETFVGDAMKVMPELAALGPLGQVLRIYAIRWRADYSADWAPVQAPAAQ